MQRARVISAFGVGAALVAGCARLEPAHDKAWYTAHASERSARLNACRADPGGLGLMPNCVNARAADADIHAARFYQVPKPASRRAGDGKL